MATKANMVIDQGTTFNTEIVLTDESGNLLDLSAYSANAQIRKWYTSSNVVPFTVSIGTGVVYLGLEANTSAAMDPGRYVYDVVVTDSGNTITRVVEGIVTITPRVTR